MSSEHSIAILKRLYRWRCIGGRYTTLERLRKGLEISDKELDEILREFANNGFIIFHRKSGQNLPALNPRAIGEIRKILGEEY